jgi:hypothetical protein
MKIISITVTVRRAVLCMGTMGVPFSSDMSLLSESFIYKIFIIIQYLFYWRDIYIHIGQCITLTSLYPLVTDNFKEYDYDTKYCLNIIIIIIIIIFIANKTFAVKAIQCNTTLHNIYTCSTFLSMCIWANIMLSPSELNSF